MPQVVAAMWGLSSRGSIPDDAADSHEVRPQLLADQVPE
jgi:hypothetical protein